MDKPFEIEWLFGLCGALFSGGALFWARSIAKRDEQIEAKLDRILTTMHAQGERVAEFKGSTETQLDDHDRRIDRLEGYAFSNPSGG